MSSLKYIAGAVADVLMPRHCAVCGRKLLVNEKHLCIYCLDDMPLTYSWSLVHNPMADRFNGMIQRDIEHYEPYAFAAGLFFFRSGSRYRNICYRLKYHGDIDIGRHFAKILGTKLAGSPHFTDVDAVVPVPLHWTRHWRRGYNQAEVIAREISSALGARLHTDMIVRRRRTSTQTRLDVEHKRLNVSGAFAIGKKLTRFTEGIRPGLPESSSKASDSRKADTDYGKIRHILIVDDVFTTGATVAACHKALRTVFPPDVRISVATLACV